MADARMSITFRPTEGRVQKHLEILLSNTSERNGADLVLFPEMIAVHTPERWVLIEPNTRPLTIGESAAVVLPDAYDLSVGHRDGW